jgi:hypothetical protein
MTHQRVISLLNPVRELEMARTKLTARYHVTTQYHDTRSVQPEHNHIYVGWYDERSLLPANPQADVIEDLSADHLTELRRLINQKPELAPLEITQIESLPKRTLRLTYRIPENVSLNQVPNQVLKVTTVEYQLAPDFQIQVVSAGFSTRHPFISSDSLEEVVRLKWHASVPVDLDDDDDGEEEWELEELDRLARSWVVPVLYGCNDIVDEDGARIWDINFEGKEVHLKVLIGNPDKRAAAVKRVVSVLCDGGYNAIIETADGGTDQTYVTLQPITN